ncbi:MAG: transposase [Planctomycetota bacterium]|nr:transposase [Planctomycetota bacterium]
MKRTKQSTFEFKCWGGARKGSGRKLEAARRSVPHRKRAEIASRHPVHVTLRLENGLESLRKRRTFSLVREALAAGSNRFGARLVQYSVMTNHLHLVLEIESEYSLAAAIKGLCVRMARALNALWARTGNVFASRYHVRALKTPSEVKNALVYVLRNAVHHGIHFVGLDPFSSAVWFDGWMDAAHRAREWFASPLPRARTWLLAHGWRRQGLIEVDARTRGSRSG